MCVIHQKNAVTSKCHRTSSQGRCLLSRPTCAVPACQNLRKAVTAAAKGRIPQTAHHLAGPQATSSLPPRSRFQSLQRMLAAPSNSVFWSCSFILSSCTFHGPCVKYLLPILFRPSKLGSLRKPQLIHSPMNLTGLVN